MSSHIRYFGKVGGAYYVGARLREMLAAHAGFIPTTQADVIKAAKLANATVVITREPRGVKHSKSLYQMACRSWLDRKKKPPVVVNHAFGNLPPEQVAALQQAVQQLHMDAVPQFINVPQGGPHGANPGHGLAHQAQGFGQRIKRLGW